MSTGLSAQKEYFLIVSDKRLSTLLFQIDSENLKSTGVVGLRVYRFIYLLKFVY